MKIDEIKTQLDAYVAEHMTDSPAGLKRLAASIRQFVLNTFNDVDTCIAMPNLNDYTLLVRMWDGEEQQELSYNAFGSVNDQWVLLRDLPTSINRKATIVPKLVSAGLGMYFRKPHAINQQIYDLIVTDPTGNASDWRESAINSGILVAWPEYQYRDVYRRKVSCVSGQKYTRYRNAIVIANQLWFKDENYISDHQDSTQVFLDVLASELGMDPTELVHVCHRNGVSTQYVLRRDSSAKRFRYVSAITQKTADRIRNAYAYIRQHSECNSRCVCSLVLEKFIKCGCVDSFRTPTRIATSNHLDRRQFIDFVKRQTDMVPYGSNCRVIVFTDKQATELVRRYKKSIKR